MSAENLASLLSLDECKVIVDKLNQETGQQLQIKTFNIISATEAKGFLGEYFHLTIECFRPDNDKELIDQDADNGDAILLRFFIKNLPPVDEEHEKVKIFRKESALYGSLLPKLQKYSTESWCPKVYLCYQNLLVLEDLDSLGFHSLASKENLSDSEMFPILNGLAAMHASSLLYELNNEESIEETYYESLKEITVHPDIPWFTTGLKAVIEVAKHHSKYQAEVSQKFIINELPLHLKNIYFMVNPSPKYRNVLSHRDTWGGNIFLHHDIPEKSAVFVDFQTCRYSPPAIDVIFTLFMNLTKQERLEKQADYLEYYYQQLVQHVTNHLPSDKSLNEVIFSEAEFLESIEEFQLFGLVYRALAASILKVPKEIVTDYYKNEERSEKLLEYMEENEEFRMLMEECIEDIIEAVVDISIKSNIY
ncbi:uncharacterized protein LOC119610396 [Lucilia sericata]|uniref:uncharacterized protein LOC119610396 n=1 Tax=Lucilia sericata TaxID=13632 RepID=UPI0018A7F38E|nr:uncharacterized protein LOC119610396 [Lucilia sericata]